MHDREPAIAATLIKRLDGSRWRALVRPAKRLKPGDVVRFGAEGRVCFLEQLDATVEAKGEGGEVTFAFAFHGAALDDALAERGDMPLPPYIGSRRTVDERDRTDYQTMFAHDGRFRRRADRGPAFHRKSGAGVTRARHRAASRDACMSGRARSCRSRPTTRPAITCIRNGVRSAPRRRRRLNATRRAGGRIVAVGSTSLRLIESAAAEDGTLAAYSRRDGAVHHAGLSLPRRRRDADQFPPAALDPVHAGRGLLRSRRDAARLCARDRERLSVLFLWRRLPVVSGN